MMKRIAAPMVGGMLTSTVLTLAVIPVVFSLWKERSLAVHADRETRRWPRCGLELLGKFLGRRDRTIPIDLVGMTK
jgi:hypothetical protein